MKIDESTLDRPKLPNETPSVLTLLEIPSPPASARHVQRDMSSDSLYAILSTIAMGRETGSGSVGHALLPPQNVLRAQAIITALDTAVGITARKVAHAGDGAGAFVQDESVILTQARKRISGAMTDLAFVSRRLHALSAALETSLQATLAERERLAARHNEQQLRRAQQAEQAARQAERAAQRAAEKATAEQLAQERAAIRARMKEEKLREQTLITARAVSSVRIHSDLDEVPTLSPERDLARGVALASALAPQHFCPLPAGQLTDDPSPPAEPAPVRSRRWSTLPGVDALDLLTGGVSELIAGATAAQSTVSQSDAPATEAEEGAELEPVQWAVVDTIRRNQLVLPPNQRAAELRAAKEERAEMRAEMPALEAKTAEAATEPCTPSQDLTYSVCPMHSVTEDLPDPAPASPPCPAPRPAPAPAAATVRPAAAAPPPRQLLQLLRDLFTDALAAALDRNSPPVDPGCGVVPSADAYDRYGVSALLPAPTFAQHAHDYLDWIAAAETEEQRHALCATLVREAGEFVRTHPLFTPTFDRRPRAYVQPGAAFSRAMLATAPQQVIRRLSVTERSWEPEPASDEHEPVSEELSEDTYAVDIDTSLPYSGLGVNPDEIYVHGILLYSPACPCGDRPRIFPHVRPLTNDDLLPSGLPCPDYLKQALVGREKALLTALKEWITTMEANTDLFSVPCTRAPVENCVHSVAIPLITDTPAPAPAPAQPPAPTSPTVHERRPDAADAILTLLEASLPRPDFEAASKAVSLEGAKHFWEDGQLMVVDPLAAARTPISNVLMPRRAALALPAMYERAMLVDAFRRQNARCAGCGCVLDLEMHPPRLCHYTGHVFCASKCQPADSVSVIPALLCAALCPRPEPVPSAIRDYLAARRHAPLIREREVHTAARRAVRGGWDETMAARRIAGEAGRYIWRCKSYAELSVAVAGDFLHVLTPGQKFTLHELELLAGADPRRRYADITRNIVEHIRTCLHCSARMHICEHCNQAALPFEPGIVQCRVCGALRHSKCCKNGLVPCPRCARTAQRKAMQAMKTQQKH